MVAIVLCVLAFIPVLLGTPTSSTAVRGPLGKCINVIQAWWALNVSCRYEASTLFNIASLVNRHGLVQRLYYAVPSLQGALNIFNNAVSIID